MLAAFRIWKLAEKDESETEAVCQIKELMLQLSKKHIIVHPAFTNSLWS